ncbi:lipase [Frondihabitans sp. PAMC 28766]|nr:lipase [Frondihabitans sp. PAMC 28766]
MAPARTPAPPFDAELGAALEELGDLMDPTLTPDKLQARRAAPTIPIDEIIGGRAIRRTERTIEAGGVEIALSIFERDDHETAGIGIYYTHGGGMVAGDRYSGAAEYLQWVEAFDAVVVSVEYRLAPEHPDPAPVDDSYAGLVWAAEHAAELGIDPSRLIVAGVSAGGGLAAGLALRARDQGGPALAGALLICPMLDDRNDTVSSAQIDGFGVWDRTSNDTGWNALLGDRRGTDGVSIYAAPARTTDLSGLPPTFIDCATAEVFRDEDVAYATSIWQHGGVAELHVWPGGYHAFDNFAPAAQLSIEARAARVAWMRRVLGA